VATAVGATAVTVVDAVLLERSKGFFRGGFLSEDYLEGPAQAAVFLLVSLIVDVAFIGLVVALVSRALAWTRLRAPAPTVAGLMLGAGLLLFYDVVSYQVLRYLGDAFDLDLMMDLVGGNVGEIVAVSWAPLIALALVFCGGCAVGTAMVWMAHRYGVRRHAGADPGPLLVAALAAVAGVVVLGVSATRSDVLQNGLLRKPAGQALAALVNTLTDVDRDGYGIVGRSSDPDATDSTIYPYAMDVPGNGVDEDGVGGDLPAAATPLASDPATPAPWLRRPDVLLVVLESFRADLVGAAFEGKPVTPVLDALAARGYSAPAAYSHNGYTVQSRFHLFSGTLAGPPGSPTIIDDFKSRGYQVGYFSGQDESFGGSQYAIGFDRADVKSDARTDRRERYTTSSTPGSLGVPLSIVEGHVREFLARAQPDRPILLCLNFHDTHFPYSHAGIETITSATRLPREDIVPGEHDRLWATYANTAANVDRAIGAVIDRVRAARGREPGVVVTSDHGESLFDEGFLGHGYVINEIQTRVPFIVANLPLLVPDPLGQSDVRPALLAAMSAEAPRAPGAAARGHAPLFQYLGDLARPKQVAFLAPGGRGRFVYDFRSGRVKAYQADWLPPAQLPKADHDEFLALIRFWERIQLARKPAWQKTGEDG